MSMFISTAYLVLFTKIQFSQSLAHCKKIQYAEFESCSVCNENLLNRKK